MRRLAVPIVTLFLVTSLLPASPIVADDKSFVESFIEGMGTVLFGAAWPTATYQHMKIGDIERTRGGGWDIGLQLRGTSAWDNPLYVNLVVTLRNGEIERIRWGKHNGAVPPGWTWSAVGEMLEEVNSKTPAAPSAASGLVTQTWTISDACADGSGLRVRFFDRTTDDRNWTWPGGDKVFEISSGGQRSFALSVRPGTKVCYGAARQNSGTTYWGVGDDGAHGCESCCRTTSAAAVSMSLTCGD